ncbi:MAG: cytochrome c [Cohaesibacter sp.]|jgi:cytochrome c556|nr:cytochrome c [Cohaesibacter sp.]
MKKLILTTTAVALTVAISLPVTVFAHGGATGVVKERMDAMGMMGDAVKALKDMMQGKTALNAEIVRKQAAIIQKHSGEALTKTFPEGSLDKPTEAKPEIWTDWERFTALANQLESYAEGLGLAADNGVQMGEGMGSGMGAMMGGSGTMGQMMGSGQVRPEDLAKMPVQGVFTMMVQTCSACHTDFRVEKK